MSREKLGMTQKMELPFAEPDWEVETATGVLHCEWPLPDRERTRKVYEVDALRSLIVTAVLPT